MVENAMEYAVMPRPRDILKICKYKKSCSYSGVAAGPSEGVDDKIS